jgi:transcriptional regulator
MMSFGECTMYIPRLFHESNWPEIKKVIEENSFATVISCSAGEPAATHVPLRLIESADGTAKLQGHVSKANPHWRLFEQEGRTLAIFTGPHAYVSPRWYDHVNVPTWNYVAVHVYGKARVVKDAAEMREMVKGLVDRYEGRHEGRHEEQTEGQSEGGATSQPDDKTNTEATRRYTLEGLPHDFLQSQMKGIVGFEISIDEVQASFKLSQNRDQKNYENVIAELRKRDDEKSQKVADLMSKRGKGSGD